MQTPVLRLRDSRDVSNLAAYRLSDRSIRFGLLPDFLGRL